MKTKTITVSEYAKRFGCSARTVQKNLKNGDILANTIGSRKTGKVWFIYVLNDWYEKG